MKVALIVAAFSQNAGEQTETIPGPRLFKCRPTMSFRLIELHRMDDSRDQHMAIVMHDEVQLTVEIMGAGRNAATVSHVSLRTAVSQALSR